jgi:hypothetical protein
MRIVVLVALIAIGVACGKSDAQKQAEQAAEEMKKAAEAMADPAAKQGTASGAQAATDMAKAMQGMAAAMSGTGPDGKPVDPVAFQTLQTHLPKMAGWEMGEPDGRRMTMPVPFSQIEADYRKGDARVEVTIVDTGFAQMLIAPWSMMLATGFSQETSDGYEKATTVNGNPAIEKWNTRSDNGELNILVGKRFMVTLDGRDLANIQELHAFASAMDLNAIAGLK